MRRSLRLLAAVAAIAAFAILPATASAGPLQLSWDANPYGWVNDDSAEFVLYSDAVPDVGDLSLSCTLDGSPHTPCAAQTMLTGLATGPHNFTIHASYDGKSDEISYEWVVSSEFGSYFIEGPLPLSNDTGPMMRWRGVGSVDGIECSLDSEVWRECLDNGREVLDLFGKDGPHSFAIRAYQLDDDGETRLYQQYPTSVSWVLDTVRPRLSTNLQALVTSRGFVLEINSNKPLSSTQCYLERIDGDDYRDLDCDDIDFTDAAAFPDGSEWILDIDGADLAGNYGSLRQQFAIQLGASVATITSGPPRFKTPNNFSIFTFTSDPGATFECRVTDDGLREGEIPQPGEGEGDFRPCTSPFTAFEPFNNHFYIFEVRAVKDGVIQQLPTRRDWFAGDRPFGLSIDGPTSYTGGDDASLWVMAERIDGDELSFQCSLDGAAFTTCSRSTEYEGLATGHHVFRVRATSDEGGYEEAEHEWTITDQPGVAIWDHPNKFTSDTAAEFAWDGVNGVSSFECALDGPGQSGAFATCGISGWDWGTINYIDLAEGTYTFHVRPAGGVGIADSYTWSIDLTPPVVSLGIPGGPITTDPFTLPIGGDEQLADAICSLDGADGPNAFFPCKDGAPLSGLTPGMHTITVTGFDQAGNMSEAVTGVFEWRPGAAGPAPALPAAPGVPTLLKTNVFRPSTPAKRTVKIPYICAESRCTISLKVRLGHPRHIWLKAKQVKRGRGVLTMRFNDAQWQWYERYAVKHPKRLGVKVRSSATKRTKTWRYR